MLIVSNLIHKQLKEDYKVLGVCFSDSVYRLLRQE